MPDQVKVNDVGELEELLLPYLSRSEADWSEEARQVRMLAYFLPGDGA